MKYVLKRGNWNDNVHIEEFETLAHALHYSQALWNVTSETEKAKLEFFYVVRCKNPDIDAKDHLEGSIIKSWI